MRTTLILAVLILWISSNAAASDAGKAFYDAYEAGREANRYQHEQRFNRNMQIENNIIRQRAEFLSGLSPAQKEGYNRIKVHIENYTSQYYNDCLKSFPFDLYTPMPSQEDLNTCYYSKLHELENNIQDEQLMELLKNLNMRNFTVKFARQSIYYIITEMTSIY
jgi:hypothetical protein